MGFAQREKRKLSDKRISKPEWHKNLEIVVLGGTIVISVIVALLDFLGALDSVPWLRDRVPILILLATVTIASYLLLERRSQFEAHESSQERLRELDQTVKQAISTIITSLDGVEFQQYESGNALLQHVNRQLLEVSKEKNKEIRDLSWSPVTGFGTGLEITKQTNAEFMKRVAKVSQNNVYQEIFIFNRPGRLEKLKQRLNENNAGYHCAYFSEADIPLLQFMVIDKKEVVFLSDLPTTVNLSIKHPGLAMLFSDYYQVVWDKATKIKEGPIIHKDVVDHIFGELTASLPTESEE